jgi:hypothetical protein
MRIKTMRKLLLAAIAVTPLMVSACAGRAPAPVQTVQTKDAMMDCTAINAEIAANTAHEGELGSEKGGKVAQNVAAGVAGLFVPVLWLAMDFQGAADTESKALDARDQYLSTLALQRCPMQQTAVVH